MAEVAPFESSLKNFKFYIHTFGCQMNENDSERMSGLLSSQGAEPARSYEESDVIIVNTCAVRQKSEEKLYSLLGRLGMLKRKREIIIGVAGCIAQAYRKELIEKRPFIDFVVGIDSYHELPHLLLQKQGEKISLTGRSRKWPEITADPSLRESRYSAYVTIMEGCDKFCSYCIVPFTRGREKCRPLPQILKEVKDLARRGSKEIQLLGQNVNSYQDPETGDGLSSLLRKINCSEGIQWIRFLTSHPQGLSLDIARAMTEAEKVCHQLHLPVQSGSTAVLKRMNRGYSREDYLSKIDTLRKLMPDISLSTDIIVGFPGEIDKEFEDTLDILKTVRFSSVFSFRYSPRPFTAAAKNRRDDVPLEEKKRRLLEVQRLQKALQIEMNKSSLGKAMKVLCLGKSKKDPNIYAGRNEAYQVVNFHSKKDVTGRMVEVRIASCGPYSLRGIAI